MRLFTECSDPLLTTGVALASYVLLSRPPGGAFIRIGQLDERFDLQAAPAVVILALVFGFYQFYRRRQLSLEAKDAVAGQPRRLACGPTRCRAW